MPREPLAGYRAKRDFARTPEPRADGGRRARAGERFVVQEHRARRLHWDLRLEHDGVLLSWAVPNGIPEDPHENRKAVHVEDHPLEYLSFEGEIPQGSYGAGSVRIWDSGTYECEKREDGKLVVVLHGERLSGRYALFRTGSEPDWMIHRMDPPAHEREPMPEHLRPMLARAGKLPAGQDGRWALEVKWDGIRAIGYWRPGRWRLESRNLNEITARYPELRPLGRQLGAREAVLDGEIVALDESGRPSFERLQPRMHVDSETAVRRLARERPVVYMIFDLLHLDGRTTMGLPYAERREVLESLGLEGPAWRVPPCFRGDPREVLRATAEQGLEGVVAKRADAPYRPGSRSGEWVKVKNFARQELVVGGWLAGRGGRSGRIGALLVGYNEGGELRYAGRVGTGFTERELGRLDRVLEPLRRPDSPFSRAGVQPPRGARFVEPRLVAEVEFTEWTRERILRHPSYKGLRDDKPPEEVVAEEAPVALGESEVEVDGRRLRISNRDKVLYPASGFTKGEMIDYYAAVAPVLLEHLRGRPLTLVRYPDGVDGSHFFEKRCSPHRPDWVRTTPVPSSRSRKPIDFCLADDLPTLIWVANLAAIELHPSLSLAADLDTPTTLVFDLDPGAPASVRECCRVALLVRELFAALGLLSFAKTSGSKGLQVYVPLNSPVGYTQTKPFARAVAELLEREHPQLVVSRMTKTLRAGRVLIDWSQNDASKTTVCAYSLRARERPTISTPLAWEEVEAALRSRRRELRLSAEPAELLTRVERDGDLFAPVLDLVQQLPDYALGRPGTGGGPGESDGGGPMPPRGVKKGSKRERQYEHIKDSVRGRGASEGRAEEIAARTVNKERARSGEAKTSSRTSTKDISSGRRGGLRSGRPGPRGRTRDQLYQEARKLGIEGRSAMNKAQLERAVEKRRS